MSAGSDERSDAFAELLEAGTSMRDALVEDFGAIDNVVVTRATSVADEPARSARVADVSPRVGESPTRFVSRVSRAHDAALIVAPETDGILGALRDAVGDERFLGCTADAIAIAASKGATRRLLSARAIATPDAWPSASRWVVKPDEGAGSLDTRRFDCHDDAQAECDRRSRRGERSTIEPWIDGEPLSVSMMCGDGHAEVLAINRQQIAVDDTGNVRYLGVHVAALERRSARASAIIDVAQRVANAIAGLHGFVGIDVVDHPRHGPVVIEVNPRVTCAYVGLSAALGRNVAVDMLALHHGSRHRHAAD